MHSRPVRPPIAKTEAPDRVAVIMKEDHRLPNAISGLSLNNHQHVKKENTVIATPVRFNGKATAGFQAVTAIATGLLAVVLTSSPVLAGCKTSPGPGVDWSGCRKRSVVLSGNDMSGADFSSIDLIGSDLRETKLVNIKLDKAQLNRTDFSRSEMNGATLSKAEAARAVFDGTNLNGANFTKAELNRASFKAANLADSDLSKSELGRADFTDANLSNSNISFANLARANFSGANVTRVELTSSYLYLTRIEGIDLSTTTGLEQGQIELACGDDSTKLPDDLQRPSNWPCNSEDD